MSALHKTMAEGRWVELSFVEKMGNIGSEVARARSADERGDINRRNNSIERAKELVDLTIAREKGHRKIELGRVRDALIMARDNSVSSVSLRDIEQYCLPFALLARQNIKK